jgi:hypothetical protein
MPWVIHGLSDLCNFVDFEGKKMSIADVRVDVTEVEGWLVMI